MELPTLRRPPSGAQDGNAGKVEQELTPAEYQARRAWQQVAQQDVVLLRGPDELSMEISAVLAGAEITIINDVSGVDLPLLRLTVEKLHAGALGYHEGERMIARAAMALSANSYNMNTAAWEPLLEPWSTTVEYLYPQPLGYGEDPGEWLVDAWGLSKTTKRRIQWDPVESFGSLFALGTVPWAWLEEPYEAKKRRRSELQRVLKQNGGRSIRLGRLRRPVRTVEKGFTSSWQDGPLAFQFTPLGDVVLELDPDTVGSHLQQAGGRVAASGAQGSGPRSGSFSSQLSAATMTSTGSQASLLSLALSGGRASLSRGTPQGMRAIDLAPGQTIEAHRHPDGTIDLGKVPADHFLKVRAKK